MIELRVMNYGELESLPACRAAVGRPLDTAAVAALGRTDRVVAYLHGKPVMCFELSTCQEVATLTEIEIDPVCQSNGHRCVSALVMVLFEAGVKDVFAAGALRQGVPATLRRAGFVEYETLVTSEGEDLVLLCWSEDAHVTSERMECVVH